jgi:nucleoside-diphosphate-sugar epimerase
MRIGEVERTYANLAKSADMLGYAPAVPFATGIAHFVRWFSAESSIPSDGSAKPTYEAS